MDVDRLAEALEPLLDAIGGRWVTVAEAEAGDIELRWSGQVVGAVRLGEEARDVVWHLTALEREFGRPLRELDRIEKQRVVKLLNERGAFQLRRSVERVAEELGVSRFTVYNYLNRPAS